MGMRKIKVGDEVQVLTGKDSGKTGVVIDLATEDRVVVSGVNVKVHHKSGGIVTKEGSIHISNVLPYSAQLKRGSRVGFQVKDGKKVRVIKKTGEVVADKNIRTSKKTASKESK